MNYPVDIIIPVWNSPVETRASLACLVEFSPQARILMINNGSERETERILDEFAEALDERAILVSTEKNVGRVAALNRGLELSAAPIAIIVQEGIKVTAGWLESFLSIFSQRPDAGLLVPIPCKPHKLGTGEVFQSELDHGSFGFMAIRRELYALSGGFDPDMDAGVWSLRDYSRRAEKYGFRTFSLKSSFVKLSELKEFGSSTLRQERLRQAELSYCSRWGGKKKFFVCYQGDEADFQAQNIMHMLLTAARQGCEITCLTSNRIHRWLHKNSLIGAHQNLVFEGLPYMFAGRALAGRINRVVRINPETLLVNIGGFHDSDICGSTIDDFALILEEQRSSYFC